MGRRADGPGSERRRTGGFSGPPAAQSGGQKLGSDRGRVRGGASQDGQRPGEGRRQCGGGGPRLSHLPQLGRPVPDAAFRRGGQRHGAGPLRGHYRKGRLPRVHGLRPHRRPHRPQGVAGRPAVGEAPGRRRPHHRRPAGGNRRGGRGAGNRRQVRRRPGGHLPGGGDFRPSIPVLPRLVRHPGADNEVHGQREEAPRLDEALRRLDATFASTLHLIGHFRQTAAKAEE